MKLNVEDVINVAKMFCLCNNISYLTIKEFELKFKTKI